MKFSVRHLLMTGILLLTFWLSWSSHHNSTEVLAMPAHAGRQAKDMLIQSFVLKPRRFNPAEVNLFAGTVKSQSPHRVKTEPERPANVQEAPPLPFKYLGRWKDSQGSHYFIDVAGEVVSVEVDQMVTPDYRVIDIKESSSEAKIVFLYLPLNQKQTMQIGKNKS